MTARDALRRISLLALLQGVALVIGGRSIFYVAERVSPLWYRPWLHRFVRMSPLLSRVFGGLEIIAALRLLAMFPPRPALLRPVSGLVDQPTVMLWRATVARDADRRFAELLRSFVLPGARILDLGCGEGDNLTRLLEWQLPFGSYLGLDISPAALARARARFAEVPKVDFRQNDLLNEQLPPGEVDLILSSWALDRIPDPFALVVRAVRQLRWGGHALLLFSSAPRPGRARMARWLALLAGRTLHPSSLYDGLPSFVAAEEFADGLVTLVVLENTEPVTPETAAG
ncbi:MAG TPA: class I SAM-dependent methyltransferase [Chloroflexota bacterium]|nr:class I SAM-dependent methyltransferase [Chloroflexota bacterium]